MLDIIWSDIMLHRPDKVPYIISIRYFNSEKNYHGNPKLSKTSAIAYKKVQNFFSLKYFIKKASK
jgi:hypothetical protein